MIEKYTQITYLALILTGVATYRSPFLKLNFAKSFEVGYSSILVVVSFLVQVRPVRNM
jgi:hypothetical protein